MREEKTAISMAALLIVQLALLAAMYFKLETVNGNLLALNQSLGAAFGAPNDGKIEKVAGVEAGSGPALGPVDAAVTLVEFSDFSCSACRRGQAALEELLAGSAGDIRRVYRHFPLESKGTSSLNAALAAECAHRQDAFWPMHERLFGATDHDAPDRLMAHAAELGLDEESFGTCLQSQEARARIEEDRAVGESYGVAGTPTLFINGHRIVGIPPVEKLRGLIADIRNSRV